MNLEPERAAEPAPAEGNLLVLAILSFMAGAAVGLVAARWVKKLVEYCNTPWNMDGVPITLGEFVEYRDPQPQTRTGVA